jgi:hypothetical protein
LRALAKVGEKRQQQVRTSGGHESRQFDLVFRPLVTNL